MANSSELNVFDENLHHYRRSGERFVRCKMESRVFLPSYRYRHSISFPYRPKPRKPLASHIHRLTLQYESNNNRQIFSKIHDDPSRICIRSIVRPKYEKSITQKKEEFLKKSSVTGSKKNCWLSQIKQARKGFSCLLPISSLSKAIAGVIVGVIIGITFYI